MLAKSKGELENQLLYTRIPRIQRYEYTYLILVREERTNEPVQLPKIAFRRSSEKIRYHGVVFRAGFGSWPKRERKQQDILFHRVGERPCGALQTFLKQSAFPKASLEKRNAEKRSYFTWENDTSDSH